MKNHSFLFTLFLFCIGSSFMSCQKESLKTFDTLVTANHPELEIQSMETEKITADILPQNNTQNKKSDSKEMIPECGIDITLSTYPCYAGGISIVATYEIDPAIHQGIEGEYYMFWKDGIGEIVKMDSDNLSCVCGDTYQVVISKGTTFLGSRSMKTPKCNGQLKKTNFVSTKNLESVKQSFDN